MHVFLGTGASMRRAIRTITLCLSSSLIFACGGKKEGLSLEKPCPSPAEFSQKASKLLGVEVLVSDMKSKGELCAYRLVLNKEYVISSYYYRGIILIGVGYEEVGDTFKPFYADWLSRGKGEKGEGEDKEGEGRKKNRKE